MPEIQNNKQFSVDLLIGFKKKKNSETADRCSQFIAFIIKNTYRNFIIVNFVL